MNTSGGYFDSERLSKVDESDRKEILNVVEFKERAKSLLLENKTDFSTPLNDADHAEADGSERFSLVKAGC